MTIDWNGKCCQETSLPGNGSLFCICLLGLLNTVTVHIESDGLVLLKGWEMSEWRKGFWCEISKHGVVSSFWNARENHRMRSVEGRLEFGSEKGMVCHLLDATSFTL